MLAYIIKMFTTGGLYLKAYPSWKIVSTLIDVYSILKGIWIIITIPSSSSSKNMGSGEGRKENVSSPRQPSYLPMRLSQ